jgi:hypothetical protein
MTSLQTYVFAIDRPAPAESEAAMTLEPGTAQPGSVTEPEAVEQPRGDDPDPAAEPYQPAPVPGENRNSPLGTDQVTRR